MPEDTMDQPPPRPKTRPATRPKPTATVIEPAHDFDFELPARSAEPAAPKRDDAPAEPTDLASGPRGAETTERSSGAAREPASAPEADAETEAPQRTPDRAQPVPPRPSKRPTRPVKPITIQPAEPEAPQFRAKSELHAELERLDTPNAAENPEAVALFADTARKLDEEGPGGPTARALRYPVLGPGPQTSGLAPKLPLNRPRRFKQTQAEPSSKNDEPPANDAAVADTVSASTAKPELEETKSKEASEPELKLAQKEPEVEETKKEPEVETKKEPEVEETKKEPEVEETKKEPEAKLAREEPELEEAKKEPEAKLAREEPELKKAKKKLEPEEKPEPKDKPEPEDKPEVNEGKEGPEVKKAKEEPQLKEAKEEIEANVAKSEPEPKDAKTPKDAAEGDLPARDVRGFHKKDVKDRLLLDEYLSRAEVLRQERFMKEPIDTAPRDEFSEYEASIKRAVQESLPIHEDFRLEEPILEESEEEADVIPTKPNLGLKEATTEADQTRNTEKVTPDSDNGKERHGSSKPQDKLSDIHKESSIPKREISKPEERSLLDKNSDLPQVIPERESGNPEKESITPSKEIPMPQKTRVESEHESITSERDGVLEKSKSQSDTLVKEPDAESLKSEKESSKLETESPKTEKEGSKLETESPKTEKESSKSEKENSMPESESPQLEIANSKPGTENSQLEKASFKPGTENFQLEKASSKPETEGSKPEKEIDLSNKDSIAPTSTKEEASIDQAGGVDSKDATKPPPKPAKRPDKPLAPKPKSALASRFEAALREHEASKPKPILKPKPRTGGASGRIGALQASMFADLNAALARPPPAGRPRSAAGAESDGDSEREAGTEEASHEDSKRAHESAEPRNQSVDENESAEAQLKAMPRNPRARARGPGGKRRLPASAKPALAIVASRQPVWELPADLPNVHLVDPVIHSEHVEHATALSKASSQPETPKNETSRSPPGGTPSGKIEESRSGIISTELAQSPSTESHSEEAASEPREKAETEVGAESETDYDERSDNMSDVDPLTIVIPRKSTPGSRRSPKPSSTNEGSPKVKQVGQFRKGFYGPEDRAETDKAAGGAGDGQREQGSRLLGVKTELDLQEAVKKSIDPSHIPPSEREKESWRESEPTMQETALVQSLTAAGPESTTSNDAASVPMLSSLLDEAPDSSFGIEEGSRPKPRLSLNDLLADAEPRPQPSVLTPSLGVSLSRYLDQSPQTVGPEPNPEPAEYFSMPVRRESENAD